MGCTPSGARPERSLWLGTDTDRGGPSRAGSGRFQVPDDGMLQHLCILMPHAAAAINKREGEHTFLQ